MNFTQKNSLYNCEKCQFKTGNKNDFARHLLTAKHHLRTNSCILEHTPLRCKICNKEYKSRHGLWYHFKKCEKTQKNLKKTHDDEMKEIKTMESLMMKAFEKNLELTEKNMELTQKMLDNACGAKINNTIINNNNHNKQFNLNVFLNENCKNAMNMKDFVNSLKIETEELENVGKLGYVEGISNIFIRGLKELNESERPMHCMDKKRETLYIKEDNEWDKDEKKDKVKQVIGQIAHKNFMKLIEWKEDNPAWENSETKKHAQYIEMVKEVFTGITPDDEIGIKKIIKKVANEVYVDKGASAL